MSKTNKIIITVGCLLPVVSCWLYYDYQNKKFEVVFFDVGQGDAAFINLPGNNEILIDGGPDMTVLYKLGKYLPVYDRSLELVILTHPHDDHLVGLIEVLKRYKVKQVMLADVKYESDAYNEFVKMISLKSSQTLKVADINLGRNNYLEVLYPKEAIKDIEFKDINNSSIVACLVTEGGSKFLFVGDIGLEIEKKLLNEYPAEKLKAEVLKVAHQGSDTSSGEEFIKAIRPSFAVILVGENKYGHPSLRVVRRLERLGAKILRTDEVGDARFKMDKNGKLEIKK